MAKIFFEDLDEEIEVPDSSPLWEPCENMGVPFSCKDGTCGTCKIRVNEGMENLSPYNDKEKNLLGEQMGTVRLACQLKINGGRISITY